MADTAPKTLTTLRLVTIIAEPVLQDRMINLVKRNGAKGYSIGEVQGEGPRGICASDVAGANLRLETIVATDVAEKIIDELAEKFFPKFSLIAFVTDVDVVRGDKYI